MQSSQFLLGQTAGESSSVRELAVCRSSRVDQVLGGRMILHHPLVVSSSTFSILKYVLFDSYNVAEPLQWLWVAVSQPAIKPS
jgi:hypothetical protein